MSPTTVPEYEAFAVAAPGLEDVIATELTGLGIGALTVIDGGVEFPATRRQLYQANLELRAASRVLVRLARFRALTFAELEKRARRIPWERVIVPGQRVALRVTCRKSRLYHSGAVAQRIERDLTERFRVTAARTAAHDEDAAGEGDTQLIVVRFDHDHCTVSADSSGAHLHQRGYRTSVTQAPMRETLAAAVILASGWDQRAPLVDPFCGSGTIPIEAALLAADIAPGRNRQFRFMHWPGYDAAGWQAVHTETLRREKSGDVPLIRGSDRNVTALRAAAENAERAGVANHVHFEKRDAELVSGGERAGWVVTNPPYGVRLGDRAEARRVMNRFGETLRERFSGWQAALLASSWAKQALRMDLETRLHTTNGGLKVHLLVGRVP